MGWEGMRGWVEMGWEVGIFSFIEAGVELGSDSGLFRLLRWI